MSDQAVTPTVQPQDHGPRRHLLDLPLETRLRIIAYCFADWPVFVARFRLYAWQSWYQRPVSHHRPRMTDDHPLLWTSRQLRAEALPMMYENSRFFLCWNVHEFWCKVGPHNSALAEDHSAQIQRVSMTTGWRRMPPCYMLDMMIRAMSKKFPRLRSLRVHLPGPGWSALDHGRHENCPMDKASFPFEIDYWFAENLVVWPGDKQHSARTRLRNVEIIITPGRKAVLIVQHIHESASVTETEQLYEYARSVCTGQVAECLAHRFPRNLTQHIRGIIEAFQIPRDEIRLVHPFDDHGRSLAAENWFVYRHSHCAVRYSAWW